MPRAYTTKDSTEEELIGIEDQWLEEQSSMLEARECYDPSYAPMLVAMLVTMLMAMFLAIAGRSSLGYRVVPKPTLFRVSLCSPEPYR